MKQDDRADWPLEPPGIWLEPAGVPAGKGRAALFLDRDGVIVEDTGFLKSADQVRLVAGIAGLIRTANMAGVPVAVVTNQSGIDRGLYGWSEFAAVQAEINRQLRADGAHVDGVAACPFHPDHTTGYGPGHAALRKPGPGMIEALAHRLRIVAKRSWLIGDRARDIEAACAAGLAGGVLLSPPNGAEAVAARSLSVATFDVLIAPDVDAAARVVPVLTE